MLKKSFLAIPILLLLTVGMVSISVSADSLVPQWIQNTALWYGQGDISEQEFLDSITYLINNKIIFLDKQEKSEIIDPVIASDDIIVSKPRINQCSVLYQAYQNVGKTQFISKYEHVTFINTCVKLYQDPIWKYSGDDRTEKLNERFIQLDQKIKEETTKLSHEPTVTILSKTKIGNEKYDVKFNVCAGDKKIDKAKVLIKSQIESVEYGTSKNVPENACRSYATQINAKNPDNIFITILEQVLQ